MDGLTKTDLLAARAIVAEHMPPTPTHTWPLLNRRTGGETWVKQYDGNRYGEEGLAYYQEMLAAAPI